MKKVFGKKSSIEGMGLYAGEYILEGETILMLTGTRMSADEADKWCEEGRVRYDDPFQVADAEYLMLDTFPNYINHSCDPNGGLRGENELVALRDIKEGDELSYDYSTVVGADEPGEDSWWMQCKCGAPICRKRVGNWQSLPKERLDYYAGNDALPNFVRRQIVAHSN